MRFRSLRRQTRAMGTEFPREEAFDEDYLYFYEGLLTPERTAGEVEAVWRLLELEPGWSCSISRAGTGGSRTPSPSGACG